jgi:hypothetical protein
MRTPLHHASSVRRVFKTLILSAIVAPTCLVPIVA